MARASVAGLAGAAAAAAGNNPCYQLHGGELAVLGQLVIVICAIGLLWCLFYMLTEM